MGFIDMHTLYTILHLAGLALGAGGAFMSDALFFSAARDKQCTPTEIRMLKTGSGMVWLGIVVLLISGGLLFSESPSQYMESSKFLAKMTIVFVIVVNGIIFHRKHLPLMERTSNGKFKGSLEFIQGSRTLFASGAVSAVSWLSALVLGALRGIPYSYTLIMSVYIAIVLVAVFVAMAMRKRLLS